MELLRLRAGAFPRGGPTRGSAGKNIRPQIFVGWPLLPPEKGKGGEKRSAPGTFEGPAAGGLDWKAWKGSGHHNLE
jgi:hypothetical protein